MTKTLCGAIDIGGDGDVHHHRVRRLGRCDVYAL